MAVEEEGDLAGEGYEEEEPEEEDQDDEEEDEEDAAVAAAEARLAATVQAPSPGQQEPQQQLQGPQLGPPLLGALDVEDLRAFSDWVEQEHQVLQDIQLHERLQRERARTLAQGRQGAGGHAQGGEPGHAQGSESGSSFEFQLHSLNFLLVLTQQGRPARGGFKSSGWL